MCITMLTSLSSDGLQSFSYWQTFFHPSDAGSRYRSQPLSVFFSGAPPWIPPSHPGAANTNQCKWATLASTWHKQRGKGENESHTNVSAFKYYRIRNRSLLETILGESVILYFSRIFFCFCFNLPFSSVGWWCCLKQKWFGLLLRRKEMEAWQKPRGWM